MTSVGKEQKSLNSDQSMRPVSRAPDETESKPSNNNSAAILGNPFPLAEVADIFRDKYSYCIGYTIETGQLELTRLGINAIDVKKSIECLGFKKLDEDVAECLLADDEKLSLMIMTSRDDYPAIPGPSYMTARLSAEPLRDALSSDWQLSKYLHQVEEKMTEANTNFFTDSGRLFCLKYFMPLTMRFTDLSSLAETIASRPGKYLVKSVRGSTPRRRQLISVQSGSSRESIHSQLVSIAWPEAASLQAYIERPLLVDKRKFDIRVFVMLVCPKRGGINGRPSESGYFAFLHPGYIRLRLEPFNQKDPEPCRDENPYPMSQQLMETCNWLPDELNAYMNKKRGSRLTPDWVKTRLYQQAGAILGYLSALFRRNLHDRDSAGSSFRILRFRMLLDESLQLHLLTVDNDALRWSRPTSVVSSVLSSLWQEAVCLACEIAARFRNYKTIRSDHLATRRNFRMIYSSEDLSLARQNVTLMFD